MLNLRIQDIEQFLQYIQSLIQGADTTGNIQEFTGHDIECSRFGLRQKNSGTSRYSIFRLMELRAIKISPMR